MTKLRSILCLLVPVAVALVLSCSESDPDAPSDQNVHPLSWVSPVAENNHADAVLQQGDDSCKLCHGIDLSGVGLIPSCLECHAYGDSDQNVHPPSWLNPSAADNHSNAVVRDGEASCKRCHGADLNGGTIIPGCAVCHFDRLGSRTPTGSSWLHAASPHGQHTAESDTCNRCHDIFREFGLPPASCHDCHDSVVSHPTGQVWLDKKSSRFHGIDARNDLASCAQCHGDDYRGGTSGVGCYACHFSRSGSKVPSGSTWTHGTTPHETLAGSATVCNQCHALNRRYGNGPASCHDCHGAAATHPTGQVWLDKKSSRFHGIDARNDLAACAQCHGDDYRGGTSGVGCYSCHFSRTGSKVPAGVSWTHGATPHEALASSEAVCNKCHGLSRNYGNGPSSCHDCHDLVATHATGASWLLPGNHAQASISDRAGCLACHDLSTGGGGTQPACRSCHTQGNPPLSIGGCTSCHSSSPSSGEHREHRDVSCTTCHNGFGTGSLRHYYPSPSPPADIRFRFSNGSDDLTYNGTSCSGTCHMGSDEEEHESERW